MGRPFKLTAPVVREGPLHQQIADAYRLALCAPGKVSKAGVTWWSVDASNYNDKIPGLRTTRGQIAGVPDLIVVYRGRAFFIEVKAIDGALSLPQQSVGTSILIAGACFGTARDATEALALLEAWDIPHKVLA